ncbi:ThiF family adenylyltransferase [Paenibacillus sp. GCM10027626]|uniref:ThiF family adenylyltransferase n=1 Tax=Paenibacillus sp. GCM10027626 TaxID=3273411 RepID=UPI003636D9E2
MDERYSRQQKFKPIGQHGQRLLEKATVAVIGCGALGSAIAEMLVRAGIGHLHLVDRDVVEISNLQRQQLFCERQARETMPKVVAAEQRLREIRSDVQLTITIDHADGTHIEHLARQCDLLMDATDNFETRIMINDAAYKYRRPWVYGACVGSTGVVFPFVPGSSACLRCLLPSLPAVNETCDMAGIIGSAVQMTAALQCTEALKWLTGNKDALIRKVHHFDLWSHTRIDSGLTRIKRLNCPTCGDSPTFESLSPIRKTQIEMLCGQNTVQVIPGNSRTIDFDEAERTGRLANISVRRTPYFVEMHIKEYRMILFSNGRLLIHGLNDVHQGRKLYHQLFG